MNYCKTFLGGRIAKDLELKYTTSGTAVLTFPVAVSIKRKDQNATTDFFDCVAWSQTAEFIAKYFRKGSSIFIEGRLQTRTYTDKDGKNRKVVEVVVEKAEFVDKPSAELQTPDEERDNPNAPENNEALPF